MKLLYITHLSGRRINRFWLSSIFAAHRLNIEFHIACNTDNANENEWEHDCKKYGVITHHIDFDRDPFSCRNIAALSQLTRLMKKEKFDIVHCNTPVGGVLGRIAAKRAGCKYVIYEAHGFHFWKGGPIKNWILYYPIERFMAYYTDVILTINQEDFLASKKFKLRKGGYLKKIHGVGVELNHKDKDKRSLNIRRELNIRDNDKIFISVGELNKNKNHSLAIKAFAEANIPNSFFVICGEGPLRGNLMELAKNMGVGERVKILGFREDVLDILQESDVFVFPSYREGLSASLMEAMASGLTCVASKIRGNVDLLGGHSNLLFNPNDESELVRALIKSVTSCKQEGKINKKIVQQYSIERVIGELKQVYRGINDSI
ncbi:glycosyltransferase family 4 protein [Limosilactobacillus vaginalis]|uniref:glycosyltransferase family 4 protein n=1 Tax=Limosilactobacillus vaginalis TaxID=1633 RepID=UPI00361CBB8F